MFKHPASVFQVGIGRGPTAGDPAAGSEHSLAKLRQIRQVEGHVEAGRSAREVVPDVPDQRRQQVLVESGLGEAALDPPLDPSLVTLGQGRRPQAAPASYESAVAPIGGEDPVLEHAR